MRIAPGRDARPSDFSEGHAAKRCPFCAGAEADTPEEVDRVVGPDGRWLTRVVPNAYPVVHGEDGAHEVVIESPRHVCRFIDLDEAEATAAVATWARRIDDHRSRDKIGYVLLFKNEGVEAGASLEHVHSQLVALREPPASFPWRAEAYAQPPAEAGATIAEQSDLAITIPPAPRTSQEVWLAPTDGQPLTRHAANVAQTLVRVLRALDAPAYNLALQTPPKGLGADLNWWRLEVIPRDGAIAGFELATGAFINSAAPQQAAETLRRRLAEL